MKKIFLPLILFLSVISTGFACLPVGEVLAATTGTIDNIYKYAWSSDVGWINFAPNNDSQDSSYIGLSIDSDGITGYAFGQNAGWINFAPANGGVLNNSSGILSGSAWGENVGWINFSNVKISCTGQFTGSATGDNVGTLNFDCQDCKIMTNWLPTQGCGTHNTCDNSQCVAVAGAGTDQCTTDAECNTEKHNACNAQGQCIVVDGSGADMCQVSDDCTKSHNECSGMQCVSVQGLGSDQCQTDANCVSGKHNSCNDQGQCLILDGQGPNTCQTDSDCKIVVVSESHNQCNFFNQCVSVNGSGANECQLDSDCGNLIIKLPPIPPVIKKIIDPVVEIVQPVTETIKKIIESPVGSVASKVITTTGVVVAASGTIAAATTTLIATGAGAFLPSLFDIVLSLIRLWGLLLTGLGIKRRVKNWGIVYDSITKQPLDPAQVLLKDSDGNIVYTAITDIDGRYGFLVPPGTYTMITKKTNYAFPSEKLAGRISDEAYNNLYFGGPIAIRNFGEVITKNVPMDPVKFDWNEFAKKSKTFMKFYSKWDLVIKRIIDLSYIAGFVVAIIAFIFVPKPYNSIILGLYLVLLFLRMFGLKTKSFGYIMDKTTSEPLSFAIVRVVIPNTSVQVAQRIADAYGRYYCLVPKGRYQVKIEKKNKDASYSPVYTSPIINVSKRGIIKEKFRIDSNVSNTNVGPKNTPDVKNSTSQKPMPEQNNVKNKSKGDEKLDIDPYLLIHQLKSPLSSMKISEEMFLDGNFGKLTPEQKEIIERMHEKSENLMSLINDISDINKVKEKFSSFNFTSENILDLISNVISLKREDINAKKIDLKISGENIPQVKIDKDKMCIAFENIIDNAIKYNNLGGKLDVSFEDKGDSLLIKFSDTGIGIPPQEKDKIFSKFFRAENAKKFDGTGSGLGLLITKSIIESHHGKIWFESEENKGTTFIVELPIQQ